MKLFVCILVLMLSVLPVCAARKPEQAVRKQQAQPVPQKTEQKKQPPVQQPSFQPTEKIQADTVVAFPADI